MAGKTTVIRNTLILCLIIAGSTTVLSSAARAEAGHCAYTVYSKALDRNLKVCQVVEKASQCGIWRTGKYKEKMAYATDAVRLEPGACSTEGIVGTCVLSDSQLLFYEGDAGDLAAGCYRMKGEWKPYRIGQRVVPIP